MSGIFTGVRAKWLPLYKELKDMAENELGVFDARETSSAMLWRHSTTFAEVSAKSDCMVVGFASETVRDEWNPSKTLQTSKNRVVHYFEVVDDSQFPVFIERIKTAYLLTKPKTQPSAPDSNTEYTTVDEYISLFPDEIQSVLRKARETIRAAAPDAVEKISWRMPTYWQGENLIHFAAFKNHLGIYPGDLSLVPFEDRLEGYRRTKGAIQFPYDGTVDYELIADITRWRLSRVVENK